jgi:hypothetical protein
MSLEHSPSRDTDKDKLADDLMIGAPMIANFLGISVPALYHLKRKKRLPIGKLGKNLFASRAKLRRAAQALTS